MSRLRALIAGGGLVGTAGLFALSQSGGSSKTVAPLIHAEAETKPALDPSAWLSLEVVEKTRLTHDTQQFRLALPDKSQVVGLPVASCLVTRAPIGDETPDGKKKSVIRPYTPISDRKAKGYFDLAVKDYPKGLMSSHINGLEVGDKLEVKGPIDKLAYKANMKKQIGMVCGGSGMTPMLQIVREIVNNPDDKTQVSLIFANKSEEDIIARDVFDSYAKKHENFQIHYVVDQASSKDWQGGTGHVTAEMLKEKMPPPSDDNLILVCGPPPMMKGISGEKKSPKEQGELSGALGELGYLPRQVYKF